MNNDLTKILGFNFSASEYALAAKTLLSRSEKKGMDNNIKKLEAIAESCRGVDERVPDKSITEQVFNRFCLAYKNPQKLSFSSRELRMLTYSMYRMTTLPMMNSFIYLLDHNWRDRFFNGLLYFMLSNWDDTDSKIMELVINLFQSRLDAYKGKRDKYLILKKNRRFLSQEGPELLGITLSQHDKGQTIACSLRTAPSVFFGLSRDKIDLQYYSRVIVAYFEKDGLSRLKLMEAALDEHNYGPTAKRLIPAIILNKSKSATPSQLEAIKTLAITEIGDPSIASKWTLSVGTEEEKENLREARRLLNEWIKRKFISIFFEKCVRDPRRKKYWIEHVDLISDFDIFCTRRTRSVLMQDDRISKLVSQKVSLLNDGSDNELSALGMTIGNYYFVEFSESGSGSIYIYRGKVKNPSYFYQLKRPHLPTIQSFMIDKDEGKLPHLSDWEKTLNQWFRNHGLL